MFESAFDPEAASGDPAAKPQTTTDPFAGLTIAGDQAVVAALAEVDFEGELWDEFADRLAGYAYPRLTGMIMSKAIYQACAERGIHYAMRLPDTITMDDARTIAGDMFVRS